MNVFEGFKRLNQFIIFLILIGGLIISFTQTAYVDKTNYLSEDMEFSLRYENELINDNYKYGKWILGNSDKKGTPEFENIAIQYQKTKSDLASLKSTNNKKMSDEMLAQLNQEPWKYYQGKNNCLGSQDAVFDLDSGKVYMKFCIQNDIGEMANKFFSEFKVPTKILDEYEKELRAIKIKKILEVMGWTLLTALAYFSLCKVVKYIAQGFIKKQ